MTLRFVARPALLSVLLPSIVGILAITSYPVPVRAAENATAVAESFALRLETALAGTVSSWDDLWKEGVRDSTHRELDSRTAAMFEWSGVDARVEHARQAGDDIVVELRLTGVASWESRAWGVASALWPLQCDEDRERNRVARREAWRLTKSGEVWEAVERIRLRPFELVDLHVVARVHPGQDALLVHAEYRIRSLFDGLEAVRFLLDRRSRIYRLTVDEETVRVVRGGELGAMGLDGFTPEVESSFRFAKPLAAGQEAVVRFRLRSPMVHMEDEGIVTTLPLRPGPFQVRAWVPVFDPAHAAGGDIEVVSMESGWEVHWPEGAFQENAFAPDRSLREASNVTSGWDEEGGVRLTYDDFSDDPSRDLDFVLAAPGRAVAGLDWDERIGPPLPQPVFGPIADPRAPEASRGFAWASRPATGSTPTLDPHPRSRASLVGPLLDAAGVSTRDLAAELADLLPVDLDFLDDTSGQSDQDAEEGADAQGAR